jgi:CDGSH-type Zn-finger protein
VNRGGHIETGRVLLICTCGAVPGKPYVSGGLTDVPVSKAAAEQYVAGESGV